VAIFALISPQGNQNKIMHWGGGEDTYLDLISKVTLSKYKRLSKVGNNQ
jgi:hypothetical protein